jgi:hypothetical protein
MAAAVFGTAEWLATVVTATRAETCARMSDAVASAGATRTSISWI